jgi:hypothetical protein
MDFRPKTATEAINLVLAQRELLESDELKVEFVSEDELGFTISVVGMGQEGERGEVQIWAGGDEDDIVHVACPLIPLKNINLNESPVLSVNAMFSYMFDRKGQNLSIVHSLYTSAGFPIASIFALALTMVGVSFDVKKTMNLDKKAKNVK